MHWRTENALKLLVSLVKEHDCIHFNPATIKTKFVLELGDWYKIGKQLEDSFINIGVLRLRRNEDNKIKDYEINILAIKKLGIRVEPVIEEIYNIIKRDEEEKAQYEAKHDIARLSLAEPEVRK